MRQSRCWMFKFRMEVKMIRKASFTLFLLIGTALCVSCAAASTSSTPQANLPNPASVYCEQQGGRLEITTAADGSQSGVCIFPDGSQCDEWAFYRGECKPGDSLEKPAPTLAPEADLPNPASVYCEQQGGKLEITTAADGSQSGVCIFPDGSRCDEWAYYRGECGPAKRGGSTPAATEIPTALPIDAEDYQGYSLSGKVQRVGEMIIASLAVPE
jgi:putative hemolysin